MSDRAHAQQLVRRGDVSIEIADQGAGPAVFMIASLGRPMGDFDDLAARLVARGYRVLRAQPRGIGASIGPMEGITLADLAEDVAHCIEARTAAPVVAIGHAFGQRVARMLAARRPDLVRAVVAIAAGGKVAMAPEIRQALLGCFDASLSRAQHLRCVATAFFAPGNDANVWRDGWFAKTAAMQSAATQASDLASWWGGGTAPMLVIQGLQDQAAPPANGRALKEAFPERVRLVEIDGAGHALLPERPAEIAAAILDFLDGLNRAG